DDPAHDLEVSEEKPKEEPEEEAEEELEEGPEEVTRVSPITPLPFSESSSDSNSEAPVTTDGTVWGPPLGSTFEVGGPSFVSSLLPPHSSRKIMSFREDYEALHSSVRNLELGMRTREHENVITRNGVDRVRRRIDAYDVDLGFINRDATRTSDGVLALQEEN
ncbi:hypothetical protein Tco_1038351, partial [Tanacetum coccineum]